MSGGYFPTARIENESGTICPRPRPLGASAGGGVDSAAIIRIRFVLASSVSVLPFQRLLDDEIAGAILLDDRQRAIALRAERLHGPGIERRAVGALANGKG